MRKLKLTINELKRQKEELKRFQRYLPTLILKKQSIQIELDEIKRTLQAKVDQQKQLIDELDQWIAVIGEDAGITGLVVVDTIETDEANVAGVDIPVFRRVRFSELLYDLYATPVWVDRAIKDIQDIMILRYEIEILRKQISRLEEELRITTQRVNLFEKVKIPQTLENMRMIQIFLGDQQTAAVVRGKIAKGKIQGKSAVRQKNLGII